MVLKTIISLFLSGFKDSIFGFIKFFNRQKALSAAAAANSAPTSSRKTAANKDNKSKLRQRLLQSCILNGVFLFLCIVSFNYVLMPSLNWMTSQIIGTKYNQVITDVMNPIISIIFSFVWIIPVFMLSKIFNVLCHQDIADIAYFEKYGRPKTYKKFTFAQVMADTIFSVSMELVFVIQSSLLGLLHFSWTTRFLVQVHMSFLYSLYAFEYKWCNKGWDIMRRIYFIETRWAYFMGFGFSLSLILSFVESYIISATLFASIFPAYILSAIESDSEQLSPIVYHKKLKTADNSAVALVPVKLQVPLFRLSLYLTDLLYRLMQKSPKISSQPAPQQQQQQAANSVRADPKITLRKTN